MSQIDNDPEKVKEFDDLFTGRKTFDFEAIKKASQHLKSIKSIYYGQTEFKILVSDYMPKNKMMKIFNSWEQEYYLAISSKDVYRFIFMGEVNGKSLNEACEYARQQIYKEIDKIFDKYMPVDDREMGGMYD